MAGIRSKAAALLLVFATLAARNALITIHLAGDSTMAEKLATKRPETGWGEALQQFFNADKVRIENHAKNGRSTRTFIDEGLWQQLIDRVHEGDYVFIQFGHNDEVVTKTDRYTPPDQYRRNLIRFVSETREKKAIPVLMTPVSRRKFEKNGTVADSHHEYSEIVRAVAAEQRIALIDMDRKSAAYLARFGPEDSKQLFLQLKPRENQNYPNGIEDNTHFSPTGAAAMANLAVEGIRELKLELANHLMSPEWSRYLAKSDSVRAVDQLALKTELQASGKSAWTPAPTASGFFLQDSMTAQWFASDVAGKLGDFIISYQAPNGGWSKRMAFDHVRAAGEFFTSADNELWFSTIDNSATTEELRFLGKRIAARDNATYRSAFARGIDYLLVAQEPNGCWPQIFPLAGSYHNAITFNDDATVNVLHVLNDVAHDRYGFLPKEVRDRARESVQHGVDCIVATQVVQNGKKTQWSAQHDPVTLLPTKARAYEHASLSGREGASIVDFLMELDQPLPEVVQAVHAAATWFKEHAIHGYTYKYKGDLTPQAGAGPLWARFYELGTNRPIFSDRDGIIRYDLKEIGSERRYGYMWYSDEPASMLRRYEKWAKKH